MSAAATAAGYLYASGRLRGVHANDVLKSEKPVAPAKPVPAVKPK